MTRTTRNHDTIRSWAEARGGHPARVAATADPGILRLDFGEAEDSLEPLDWDEFFSIFDDRGLTFLFQDRTLAGEESRFNKFVRGPE